jgi:hypothetical protein
MHIDAPTAVERNLLAAFRKETARRHATARGALAWRFVWVSVAVLALLAAGLGLYSTLRLHYVAKSENGKNGQSIDLHPTFSQELSGASAVTPGNRGPATNKVATLSRRHIRKHGRSTPGKEMRSPIESSDELSLNGGGSIVRVNLPFSSLTAMGLPVRPDLSETRVTADVWLDPFGAVVGIRLVPANASAD